jgi:predicted GTPase
LNLHLDIVTEKELKQQKIKKQFEEKKDIFLKDLLKFQNEILNKEVSNEIKGDKKQLSQQVTNIVKKIEEIKNRPLKIAVMATKKAGKSVIVNSFLEEEYAPTSLELATPNSIIYEAWDNDYIEVKVEKNINMKRYKKEVIKTFQTPTKVKEFIKQLFKNASEDIKNNKSMPDIYIKYPKKDKNYVIIDTPGPDRAGTNHSEIAYKWLKKADVVLFAIDYEKHLTNDEIEFLNNVKKELEKMDKFHSLILTINKIDRRYQSNEKKSVVRIMDFIKDELIKIDENFKSVPLVATSALEYFNMLEIVKKFDIKDEKLDINLYIKKLRELNKEKKLNEEGKTIYSFIKEMVGKFEDFHYIDELEIKDIIIHSGMRYLINRTDYIANEKAGLEIFNKIFSDIDKEIVLISNKFLTEKILGLEDKKKRA